MLCCAVLLCSFAARCWLIHCAARTGSPTASSARLAATTRGPTRSRARPGTPAICCFLVCLLTALACWSPLSPTPSDPGTFQGKEGQTSCDVCQPGTYQDVPGFALCWPCLYGTYSAVLRSRACIPCEAGKHRATNGSSSWSARSVLARLLVAILTLRLLLCGWHPPAFPARRARTRRPWVPQRATIALRAASSCRLEQTSACRARQGRPALPPAAQRPAVSQNLC